MFESICQSILIPSQLNCFQIDADIVPKVKGTLIFAVLPASFILIYKFYPQLFSRIMGARLSQEELDQRTQENAKVPLIPLKPKVFDKIVENVGFLLDNK